MPFESSAWRLAGLVLTCFSLEARAAAGDAANGGAAYGGAAYATVRQAQPEGRSVTLATPLRIERDVFSFQLDSGTVYFMSPWQGRSFAVVFLGRGSFELHPATEDERNHLAFLTGKEKLDVLRDSFESLVLVFGDDTAEELALAGSPSDGSREPRALAAYQQVIDWQRNRFHSNLVSRVVEDLLNQPEIKNGAFLAFFDGNELPPAMAAVDPRGVEALRIGAMGGEDSVFLVGDDVRGGLWYCADRKGEIKSGRRVPFRPAVNARHYLVETTVGTDEELAGTTTVDLVAEGPLRAVPFSLAPTLRIGSAELWRDEASGWTPVPWSQEGKLEDPDPMVFLPAVLPKGSEFKLRLSYRGKEVISESGEQFFFVAARANWYPNFGLFSDLATYDLVYRVPKDMDVVSVGNAVGSTIEGKQKRSDWKLTEAARVAGFNFGKFNRFEQQDELTGLEVEVYADRKGASFVSGEAQSAISESDFSPDSGGVVDVGLAPSTGRGNNKTLAEGVAIDVINANRVFTRYFGALPQKRVAISQQMAFGFAQSWPSLIYMPYSAFMTGTARNTIGLSSSGYTDFVKNVGFHEMAHQWWGHLVGWSSYRDQWLSEGFAEFSAALAVQHARGWADHDNFWKEARKALVERDGVAAPYQVGPITRGFRLSTSKSPRAYAALAYQKGGFVLHMLRMMMMDPASSQSDMRFITMMRDFTATYAGKAASTEDFKKVVEKHMVPAMNATGDGKIDWFFDQWVYGTEIPRLNSQLKFQRVGDGEYQVTGTVALSEASAQFRALVPIYADFGKGRMAMVGRLPFAGPASRAVDLKVKLPEKPKQFLANARFDVLLRD